jgi:mono/diheme cytochrome c family protein
MPRRLLVTLVAIALLGIPPLTAADPATTAAGPVDFAKQVRPILEANCLKCHGADKHKGGLRLDSRAALLAGGDSGPAVVTGSKAADSRLIRAVAGLDPDLKMPPTGPRLSEADVATLRTWIEQGAAWDRSQESGVRSQKTVKSDHWAFQPIKRPTVPEVPNPKGEIRNPIDAFIIARLAKEGLAPSPEADRPTLLRRVTLDLTGLPPTPAEVEQFVHDSSPDAFEQVVRRLLASPAYGERWARHWLDAARYADSDGFEKDSGRPWAWRYRWWVIEALNRDEPYDQFAVEQLAGDLLPNATMEQKVATGFHRNTLTNKEGGVDQEQYRVEQIVDRVNTTGKVFLGVTVGCCQCHDHKYDPLTQREYYQLFAFFNSDHEADVDAPLPGEAEIYQRKKAEHDRKREELKAAIAENAKTLPARQEQWEAKLTLPQLRAVPEKTRALLLKEAKDRTTDEAKELAAYFAKQDPTTAKVNKALADHERQAPSLSKAPTMAVGPVRTTHVLLRGDFLRPGAEVTPGTPAVLPPLSQLCGRGAGREGLNKPALTPDPSPAKPGEGRDPKLTRLDLARWIVAPDNPLTARVAVNWVWQKFFGRGIVATPEDFGTQGDRPSHPELFDWLASEFVRRGWDLKELHFLIVTSATYRQSSAGSPELRDRDPLNVLLARQSRLRLEAEVVRDVSLAAGGLLAPRVGGPSVRPPQPAGISELTYAGGASWPESTGADRYRRGLYTWFQRTSPYPMLMTFDSPDSNVCTVRRERSNTPLQALTLLNDPVFVECARGLARRVLADRAGQPECARVRYAVRLCLGRDPTPAERERLLRLLDDLRKQAAEKPADAAALPGGPPSENVTVAEAAAWVPLARVLLNLDEFVTRE